MILIIQFILVEFNLHSLELLIIYIISKLFWCDLNQRNFRLSITILFLIKYEISF